MEDNLERTESVADEHAEKFGRTVFCLLFLALYIYKMLTGIVVWDLFALFLGYSSAKKFCLFKYTKSKRSLFFAIFECLIAILSVVAYVKATW